MKNRNCFKNSASKTLPCLIFLMVFSPQDAITRQVSQLRDKISGWFSRSRKRSRHTFIGPFQSQRWLVLPLLIAALKIIAVLLVVAAENKTMHRGLEYLKKSKQKKLVKSIKSKIFFVKLIFFCSFKLFPSSKINFLPFLKW